MNILLINVPSRRGINGFHLPLGLLYVGAIIKRCGHVAKIVDPYLHDIDLKGFDSGSFDYIHNLIRDYKPSIVGYGGIVTSYGRTKRLAWDIKNNYPDILQIAGGTLASVAELLLKKAGIDIVFHGETEISLPIFLEKYERKTTVYDVPGISYMTDDKGVITTSEPEQIKDLDSIPFPAYHLVEVEQYFESTKSWLDANRQLFNTCQSASSIINRIGNRTHYIPISTARGCTHRCFFCYRHMYGVRQYSPRYVVNHIRYLKTNYGVEGFNFSDEFFNSNTEWVLELCDLIEEENLNIFYLIGGARVDKMNKRVLCRLRETGCIEINYGQESGSDIILKEYRKGVSVQQNREITALTNAMGITCPVQIVIGSPSETNETIKETVKFLKSVDAYRLSWNYLIPLPKTPSWQYVEKYKLISDLERYLDLVAEYGGSPLINLTKMADKVWKGWSLFIRKEMNLHYYRRTNLKVYIFYRFLYFLADVILPIIPDKVRKSIPTWAKSWYWMPRL